MWRVVKIFLGLLLLAGLVAGGYAWIRSRGEDGPELTLVEVVRGEITEKAVAVGQIEPRQKFHVKSNISGIVRRCAVEVGEAVGAGDPLFEITPDPTPVELLEAERRLQRAQSALARAEADWARFQELARQGIESRDKLDAQRETFELARIEQGRSQDALQMLQVGRLEGRGARMDSVIRAPAAGIVLQRMVNPGDPVVPLTSYQEGTELATVADMSDLIFKGTVDEIDVGKLRLGLPARLKVGALPEEAVTGRLTRIAPQAIEKDNAKLFEVEIELDPAQRIELRAGYSANADLVIREKQGILVIPERLVIFEQSGAETFVEVPGETPEAEPRKVPVELGLSDGLNIEVVSGLAEGAKVVQRPPREITG